MTTPASIQIGTILGTIATLALLERLSPLRKATRPFPARLLANGFLSLTTYVVATLVLSPTERYSLHWAFASHFGLLNLVHLPVWLESCVGFLLLDLTFYYWHRLTHETPFLWRFHNVHHIDPDLDVTTAFRFHFGEVFISLLLRLVQCTWLGVSPAVFASYELVFQVAVYFHHSNLKLSVPLERVLNLILVTPRMHSLHHSQFHEETDSNYSTVFSFWDRLHRSIDWVSEEKLTISPWVFNEDRRYPRLATLPFHLPA